MIKNFIYSVVVLLIISPSLSSQESTNIDYLKGLIPSSDSTSLYDALKKQLEDPETLNKALEYLHTKTNWDILKNLNIKFKTFNSNKSSDKNALGFNYSFSKDVKSKPLTKNISLSVLSLTANGNVAFDKNSNPLDFLETRFSSHIYGNYGGIVNKSDTVFFNKIHSLKMDLVSIKDVKNSPLFKEVFNLIQQNTSTQFYWDLSIKGSLESDQSFNQKQYVYGINLGFDIKAWNSNSVLTALNIFDWPFSFIRILTGCDKEWNPRGYTIPTILTGIENVNPQKDSMRVNIAGKENYYRIFNELAFKTQISESSSFISNFRYYKELNALKSIKTAKIDECIYFTSAILLSNGLYISYTTGKLPLSAKDDQIYEIGFQYNFN